ncbi:unnamed protein product [Adineta steineri]|uniref:Uncharacterized protein n=1 Tax=Adineta steineri TaxID=433720 RepID=A0A819F649_9BILA|nr:unnamed protein product [Adineta steineri]CAF3862800.1 unnamed protein product [Adineta steineri]
MKYIFIICFLPVIFSSPYYHEIEINSDDDCWSSENNNKTIDKNYATLVKFSPKIAYGKDSCSVFITNPWLKNIQNGFGLFLSREMDCASTLTIDCLPNNNLINQVTPAPKQFTCHTSKNKIEMLCNTIRLTYKRNLNSEERKRTTQVQVVALAKEPCDDSDIFFQCQMDYPNSCIDTKLQCNGRSECPSGYDERNCHNAPSDGISITAIILITLALIMLFCILSTVLICCCCRAAFNGIVRRFRSKKGNNTIQKGDITISGEDAGLMKGLTAPATVVEILPQQQYTGPPALIINSTKPIYPRLE